MSDDSNSELEKRVLLSLQEMAKQYKALNTLADDMLAKQARQQSIADDMKGLKESRQKLEYLETQSRPDQQAYRSSGKHASSQVKQVSGDTAASIQALIVKIAELEKNTRESYDRLVPEVNQVVRGHQMQRAYIQSR